MYYYDPTYTLRRLWTNWFLSARLQIFCSSGSKFFFPYLERNVCCGKKASARLLEDLEASWEAAKDSEQLVPMKTLPVRCLLDLTAWHHLSFISWRNWKFLGWHIFIGSVWYLKMYKSYGSTLGFSKIYQQITKWNPSVQANGWD